MKPQTRIGLLLLGAVYVVPVGAADDPNLGLIKARQGEMQLRSFNAGPLFGMARGKIPYDAELASTSASNLKAQLLLDMGRAWAEGTGSDKYSESDALPEIWSTYPEIADKGKAYADAVTALADAAGNGFDALRPAVSDLGSACKGCHDDFRKEK